MHHISDIFSHTAQQQIPATCTYLNIFSKSKIMFFFFYLRIKNKTVTTRLLKLVGLNGIDLSGIKFQKIVVVSKKIWQSS